MLTSHGKLQLKSIARYNLHPRFLRSPASPIPHSPPRRTDFLDGCCGRRCCCCCCCCCCCGCGCGCGCCCRCLLLEFAPAVYSLSTATCQPALAAWYAGNLLRLLEYRPPGREVGSARINAGSPPAAAFHPPPLPPLAERRAFRARYRRQEGTPSHTPHLTQHFHYHTSRCRRQTPGFPRERFFPLGGGRSAHPPNPKPCFIPPTNLSDSPPAELDACHLSPPRVQETPSEPPRWSVRSPPPPAASPRCWSRPDVSLDTRTGVPPRCRRRGGRGPSDRTTTPPHPTPHPPASLTPSHPTRTHDSWLPSPGRPSSARPWYPPTASDTIDQAPPP